MTIHVNSNTEEAVWEADRSSFRNLFVEWICCMLAHHCLGMHKNGLCTLVSKAVVLSFSRTNEIFGERPLFLLSYKNANMDSFQPFSDLSWM